MATSIAVNFMTPPDGAPRPVPAIATNMARPMRVLTLFMPDEAGCPDWQGQTPKTALVVRTIAL
ncbi:hypothetical protein PSQ19_14970 [Devosia algicola]|uniref:Uncharacterized protein n=1 Tax=Devosia algicola TaxID=3026418 RepID=A0ABY7YL05_9HYPH|nr:hypothetical protein [Devosia algicola]WDR01976.1 hypothetical protein PSQ19_14970 [Devosia algicola]